MSTFTNKTGLQILELINSLKTNYGRNNISKIVWRELGGFSIQQAKDLISQLVEKGYLKEINVGISFAISVITLTDKGKEALKNKEDITLDFQKFYTADFKQAADIGIVDKDIIEEFYSIKKELIELQKREGELKETIKKAMTEKNVGEIHSELMDIYCRKVERVVYLKEKIERFVPQDILEKIRIVNERIVLTTKLKETSQIAEGGVYDANTPAED